MAGVKTRERVARLRALLSEWRGGALPVDAVVLLALIWRFLEGPKGGEMGGRKLLDRVLEAPKWDAPILGFSIERHPSWVTRKGRALVQRFSVDLEGLSVRVDESEREGTTWVRGMRRRREVVSALVEEVPSRASRLLPEVLAQVNAVPPGPAVRIKREADRETLFVFPEIVVPREVRGRRGKRKRFGRVLRVALEDAGWTARGSDFVYVRRVASGLSAGASPG